MNVIVVFCMLFTPCRPENLKSPQAEQGDFFISVPGLHVTGETIAVPVRIDGEGLRSYRFSILFNPERMRLTAIEFIVPEEGSFVDANPDINHLRGSVILTAAHVGTTMPGDVVILHFEALRPGNTAIRLGYARVNELPLQSMALIHGQVNIHNAERK